MQNQREFPKEQQLIQKKLLYRDNISGEVQHHLRETNRILVEIIPPGFFLLAFLIGAWQLRHFIFDKLNIKFPNKSKKK